MKDKHYSFVTAGLMDASRVFMQTAVPLLALHLPGATDAFLGTIGATAQAVRLPFSFSSGRISEKLGRSKVSVPAAVLMTVSTIALASAHNLTQLSIWFVLGTASLGLYFPPLQAKISEVSKRGDLRKNLSWFNFGWCAGTAVSAISVKWLVKVDLSLAFYAAAFSSIMAMVFILAWRSKGGARPQVLDEDRAQAPMEIGPLLVISRIVMFTGYFGYGAITMLFPKLVSSSYGWTKPTIASVIAFLLVGQSLGIVLSNTSSWWRGKLWPLFVSSAVLITCSALIAVGQSANVFRAAFFCMGCTMGIVYTGALYYGMASRKALGRNAGFHESIIALGNILGCLLGGLSAQFSGSLRTPYYILCGLAILSFVVAAVFAVEHFAHRKSQYT